MLLLAKMCLGNVGAVITIIMLIASMILIIQTALIGSSMAMQSMASEGNLPKIFAKTNKFGTPVIAMVSIIILNLLLIFLGTPSIILAASAMGYVIANGISLFAYVKAKSLPDNSNINGGFKAPKGWKFIALFCSILNIPFYLIGIIFINSIDYGTIPAILGILALLLYIPLWFYSKWENNHELKVEAITDI
jgi:amino acid transporter